MFYDVFISYSWTEGTTKVFAHDLATHLQTIGFNVGIDINVDYGNSLTGFMNSICDANHVLMIAGFLCRKSQFRSRIRRSN